MHNERALVRALRHPSFIVKDVVHDGTLNFFGVFDNRHHVMVSVDFGTDLEVGRVKSARVHRMSRTLKMKKAIARFGEGALVFEHWGK